jgi:hypothetical protein
MKSVEHFAESLARLNERKFFELSRNFLGDVKTPYNKQVIIERLISCLSGQELRTTLASYLTAVDALVMNAVDLLENPRLQDICAFLSPQVDRDVCLRVMTSLEERLFVYTFTETGWDYYALNPVFEPVFRRILDDKSALFPGTDTLASPQPEEGIPPVDKRFLLAFFSFIHSRKLLLKADNTPAKKSADEAVSFFPGGNFWELLAAAEYWRIVFASGNRYHVNMRALRLFLRLTREECLFYLAAGICAGKEYAPLFADFFASLPPGKYFAPCAIHRILRVIFRRSALEHPASYHTFLKAALKTGLLLKVREAGTGEIWYTAAPRTDASGESGQPDMPASIAFDSPFSFIVLPNAESESCFDLISFSAVENAEECRFAVTREMVVRYLECGRAEAEPGAVSGTGWILERLTELSGGRLDEALVWSVREWEKRFHEVLLHEGLVLYLDKTRRYLAESEGLKPYIGPAIAEGLFVIQPKHREAVETALTRAGVDIIGNVFPPQNMGAAEDEGAYQEALFDPLPHAPRRPRFSPENRFPANGTDPAAPPPVDYRKKFKSILLSIKGIAENEKQELMARIDRGLIFSGEQLQKLALPGTFPYEKNEAHGMDYSGKLSIAKNAAASRGMVEIVWHAEDGEKRAVCVIECIEKKQTGDILGIRADQVALKVPLGKVTVIRKMKQSIFD